MIVLSCLVWLQRTENDALLFGSGGGDRYMRMRSTTVCLLTLCQLAGCSQTGAIRPGASSSSDMRTVASVGDRPLPVVAGEPGSSLRTEVDDVELPESSGSRISGRVYDERGKPVPNAKVRLAVNSSPGGKIDYATTTRDGGFTLRGLRAGSSYSVIAEYQGEDGMMTGRVQTKAPETGVRISLKPRDGAAGQGHASIRPARPRVEPISNIDPADDEPDTERRPAGAGKVNNEDIELPTEEAAIFPPRGNNTRLARASNGDSSSSSSSAATVRAGWNVHQNGSARVAAVTAAAAKARADEQPAEEDASSTFQDSAGSRRAGAHDASPEFEDDGPNPLPPALDTAGVGLGRRSNAVASGPLRVARNSSSLDSGSGSASASSSGAIARLSDPTRRRSAARAASSDDSRSIGLMDSPGDREPASMPEEVLRGSRVIAPNSSGPIVIGDDPEADDARNAAASPRPTKRARRSTNSRAGSGGNLSNPPRDLDSSDGSGGASDGNNDVTRAAVRPTWRELSQNQPKAVPRDESIRQAGHESVAGDDRGVVTLTGASAAAAAAGVAKPSRPRLLGGARPPVDDVSKQAVCRFDPSERRIVDFQLPGLDGKVVSLHDADADLILLDFWGSWCAPCRTSIPHLAELHEKLAAKGVKVIGIACEKGESFQDRRAHAEAAVRDLNINYPVLISNKDGGLPRAKSASGPVLSDDDPGGSRRAFARTRARGNRGDVVANRPGHCHGAEIARTGWSIWQPKGEPARDDGIVHVTTYHHKKRGESWFGRARLRRADEPLGSRESETPSS